MIVALFAILGACAPQPARVKPPSGERHMQARAPDAVSLEDLREPHMCMGPQGQWDGYDIEIHPVTRMVTNYCRFPKKWVKLPVCKVGQKVPDDDGPDASRVFAERLKDARDNSLHGDDYQGLAWCMAGMVIEGFLPPPPPPQPPRRPDK